MHVIVYSADWCRYCSKVKEHLKNKNIDFEVVDVDKEPEQVLELMSNFHVQTLPQVFVNGELIGGCEDTIKCFK